MATDVKTALKFKHFGSLKQELEAKKCPDERSKNLYDHMAKVMDHIIMHAPNEALNKLEEISYLIKSDDKKGIQNFLLINRDQLYNKPGEETIKKATEQYIKDAKSFWEVSTKLNYDLLLFMNIETKTRR